MRREILFSMPIRGSLILPIGEAARNTQNNTTTSEQKFLLPKLLLLCLSPLPVSWCGSGLAAYTALFPRRTSLGDLVGENMPTMKTFLARTLESSWGVPEVEPMAPWSKAHINFCPKIINHSFCFFSLIKDLPFACVNLGRSSKADKAHSYSCINTN